MRGRSNGKHSWARQSEGRETAGKKRRGAAGADVPLAGPGTPTRSGKRAAASDTPETAKKSRRGGGKSSLDGGGTGACFDAL
mmetsp:Transcript_5747/g.11022  ORF Transcript_5747/g.11022 Transcript_5747/m.11022 type:complete len:82 (+) Transcript_5747:189-434(+)